MKQRNGGIKLKTKALINKHSRTLAKSEMLVIA